MRAGDTAFGGQPVASCIVGDALMRVRDAQRVGFRVAATRGSTTRDRLCRDVAHLGLMRTSATVQLRTDGSIALATGCVDIGRARIRSS